MSRAVQKYRQGLLGEGIPVEVADARAGRYSQKLLNYRARVIARHETMTAANYGSYTSQQHMIARGMMDKERTYKTYTVTPDDRLCDICAPLDGQERKFDEPFDTDVGAVMIPPVHVQCRCTYGLVYHD
jgi:SPP1 gp7 family putative phage head morphogenesis protein